MSWFAYLILGIAVMLIAIIILAPAQRYRFVRWRRSLRRADR